MPAARSARNGRQVARRCAGQADAGSRQLRRPGRRREGRRHCRTGHTTGQAGREHRQRQGRFFCTKRKTRRETGGSCFCGGEEEIRTLGTLLTYTRFPIVLLRPTRTPLRVEAKIFISVLLPAGKEKMPVRADFSAAAVIFPAVARQGRRLVCRRCSRWRPQGLTGDDWRCQAAGNRPAGRPPRPAAVAAGRCGAETRGRPGPPCPCQAG